MKMKMMTALTGLMLVGLTACETGGSGSNNGKDATVPVAPNRIQVVYSNGISDPNNYCDYTSDLRSITCSSLIPGTQNLACPSVTLTADTNSLCQNMLNYLNGAMGGVVNNNSCGRSAMQYAYMQKCQNVGQNVGQNQFPTYPSTGNPIGTLPNGINQPAIIQPIDPSLRVIQCDFEATRVKQRRYTTVNYGTGHLTTSLVVNSRVAQTIDLRSKFLGFDIGDFGTTQMTFTPANLKNAAESLTLTNQGLNGNLVMSQSGLARQGVVLEAESDDGSMKLSVSCTDRTNAVKGTVDTIFTTYNCKGVSKFGGVEQEQISLTLPYDKNLLNNEISLAEGLVTMKIVGDTNNQNNARVILTSSSLSSEATVRTSAYLKSPARLVFDDGARSVDVTCKAQ